MERLLWITRWAQRNYQGPIKKKAEESELEREDVRLEAEAWGRENASFWLLRWRKGPGVKEHRWPLEDGKVKEMDLAPKPPDECRPADSLILAHWNF